MPLWDDFTGKSAQKDLKKAEAERSAAEAAAKQGALTETDAGYTKAFGALDPYDDKGTGNALYRGSIGADGAEGYQKAFNTFNADPFRAGREALMNNALTRQFRGYNVGGMGNSGAARAGIARASGDFYNQDVADMRDRWQGLGQQGLNVAGTRAGMFQQQGSDRTDIVSGFGQREANAAVDYGAAMGGTRGTAINNLIRLLGAGAKAYSAFKGGGMPPVPGGG